MAKELELDHRLSPSLGYRILLPKHPIASISLRFKSDLISGNTLPKSIFQAFRESNIDFSRGTYAYKRGSKDQKWEIYTFFEYEYRLYSLEEDGDALSLYPMQAYLTKRFSPDRQFLLDVIRYIKDRDIELLTSILDSLLVLCALLRWTETWDAKLSKADIVGEGIKSFLKSGPFYQLPKNSDAIDVLTGYFDQGNAYSEKFFLPRPDKVNICRHPNMSKILEHLERNSKIPEVKTVLASLYILTHQEDKATKIYKDKHSMEFYDHYLLGNIYLRRSRELATAEEHFKESLCFKAACYNLGVTYLKKGEHKQAANQFEELINSWDLDGTKAEEPNQIIPLTYVIEQFCRNNLGIYYHRTFGNLRKALSLFQKAKSLGKFTGLDDGIYNEQYTQKKILEAAAGPLERISKKRKKPDSCSDIVGESEVMYEVYEEVDTVAASDLTVLLTGETGVGKEKVANAIRRASPRKDKPFVVVEVTSIPENLMETELFGYLPGAFSGADEKGKLGRFEMADGGTLFIDELGDLNMELQPKLLRAVEEKEFWKLGAEEPRTVDVRLILATNRDLAKDAQEGRFREDLYYRVNQYPISIPPLRNRGEDIILLANYFLEQNALKSSKSKLTPSNHTCIFLKKHPWPGNVRELEGTIERAVARAVRGNGKVIHLHDIREVVKSVLETSKGKKRRQLIAIMLKETNGNVLEAARISNMHRSWLNRNMSKLCINASKYKPTR